MSDVLFIKGEWKYSHSRDNETKIVYIEQYIISVLDGLRNKNQIAQITYFAYNPFMERFIICLKATSQNQKFQILQYDEALMKFDGRDNEDEIVIYEKIR